MTAARDFDLILFGASGFSGVLTASYLARHAPPGTRWALAGRDQAKLERVRADLARENPACRGLPMVVADVCDPQSMSRLAQSSRVVISTVGPYLQHGEPLVAACSRNGTDYVDLAAESEFVDRMYMRHHAQAARSGARLVHSCGFNALVFDLGALLAVSHLPSDQPIELDGFLRISMERSRRITDSFSGGTVRSTLTMFSRTRSRLRVARERQRANSVPDRYARLAWSLPRYEDRRGIWIVPARTIDSLVVRRSADALESYGPAFRFRQHVVFNALSSAIWALTAAGAVFVLAHLPPARLALVKRAAPGTGPGPELRRNKSFELCLVGKGGASGVVVKVAGGDPGYEESAKMLAESAMALAFDDLPRTAGQVTAAVAMGETLIARLRRAGIAFDATGHGTHTSV